MHFDITKCKIFLGNWASPCNIQKSYTYIYLDQKRGLKFGNSSPIVEFFYAKERCPVATPKSYTRAWNYAFYLCHQIQIYKGALPLTPVKGFAPGGAL